MFPANWPVITAISRTQTGRDLVPPVEILTNHIWSKQIFVCSDDKNNLLQEFLKRPATIRSQLFSRYRKSLKVAPEKIAICKTQKFTEI